MKEHQALIGTVQYILYEYERYKNLTHTGIHELLQFKGERFQDKKDYKAEGSIKRRILERKYLVF